MRLRVTHRAGADWNGKKYAFDEEFEVDEHGHNVRQQVGYLKLVKRVEEVPPAAPVGKVTTTRAVEPAPEPEPPVEPAPEPVAEATPESTPEPEPTPEPAIEPAPEPAKAAEAPAPRRGGKYNRRDLRAKD